MSRAGSATLVTGAAGFAGSHLIDRLVAGRAAHIHGWALPGSNRPSTGQVTWHDVDLTDRSSVLEAVRAIRPGRVFHLAGAPSVETSWTNAVPHLSVNAMGTSHLLDALQVHAPDCRVLVITSAQVYSADPGPLGEDTPLVPATPYGLTKLAQDLIALNAARAGFEVLVARPFNHVGPRQTPGFAVANFARQIARIERGLDPPCIRVGNLDASRDFTDVRDVADAYLRLMDRGVRGQAYNVCSGTAYRIGDLLERLIRLSTATIAVELDPARLRPADVALIVGDPFRLQTATGWSVSHTMDATLRDTLDWWRQEVAHSH